MPKCLVHRKVARRSWCHGDCVLLNFAEESDLSDFQKLHERYGTDRIIKNLQKAPRASRRNFLNIFIRHDRELTKFLTEVNRQEAAQNLGGTGTDTRNGQDYDSRGHRNDNGGISTLVERHPAAPHPESHNALEFRGQDGHPSPPLHPLQPGGRMGSIVQDDQIRSGFLGVIPYGGSGSQSLDGMYSSSTNKAFDLVSGLPV